MLVEFRVRNYRSLRDEQVFTLVAAKDSALSESNVIETAVKSGPDRLVRAGLVYGPNSAGKSNLIRALHYMRAVVVESATQMQAGQTFAVQPFRLDPQSATKPSEFEITVLIGGVRYQYGYTMNSVRILSEYLLVYRTAKAQTWFQRVYDPVSDSDSYNFGSHLQGQRALWEKSTRPNALFLSTAVQLNSEQLQPLFHWFASQLVIFNDITPLNPAVSVSMLHDVEGRRRLREFLFDADISIADIDIKVQKLQVQAFRFDFASGRSEVGPSEQEITEVSFRHSTTKGEAVLSIDDESKGTRQLFYLGGPILRILETGATLVVDELDTSLHPLLVRRIVNLFQDATLNKNGAQLVFTTHDTSLLDPELIRRDQVWFVEKDIDQASTIYPLSDFSPRKNEAWERGYLIGRYGALPFFDKQKD